MNLVDISKLPNYNSSVSNGSNSVSERRVFFGKLGWMLKESVNCVCCIEHGACLCVGVTKEGGLLYRCEVCNEGAYALPQATTQGLGSSKT